MMLDHLGEASAAADIMTAIEEVLETGPRTPDMKGTANTREVGIRGCRGNLLDLSRVSIHCSSEVRH